MSAYRLTYGTASHNIFNAPDDDAALRHVRSYVGHGSWTDFTGLRVFRYEPRDQAELLLSDDIVARIQAGRADAEWLAAQGAPSGTAPREDEA